MPHNALPAAAKKKPKTDLCQTRCGHATYAKTDHHGNASLAVQRVSPSVCFSCFIDAFILLLDFSLFCNEQHFHIWARHATKSYTKYGKFGISLRKGNVRGVNVRLCS